MTALKEQWQQQRQYRQQELLERRQKIQTVLTSLHAERQVKSSQLRNDLKLFQLELQQSTQELLQRFHHQRHTLIQQLFKELQSFTQKLELETTQILNQLTAERSRNTDHLMQELNQSHHQLQTSVASLRDQFKIELLDLKEKTIEIRSDTQIFLTTQRQERLQIREQLILELRRYVDNLHLQVGEYLTNLELLRQERSQQLKATLSQQQQQRISETDSFFQMLVEFRQELQTYRFNLHRSVWGEESISITDLQSRTHQENVGFTLETISESASLDSVSSVAVNESNQSIYPSVDEAMPESIGLEEAAYTFLCETQGARLNEIESKLGSNRFRVVNALRSLIQKGLVTQRDRVYYVQEDIDL